MNRPANTVLNDSLSSLLPHSVFCCRAAVLLPRSLPPSKVTKARLPVWPSARNRNYLLRAVKMAMFVSGISRRASASSPSKDTARWSQHWPLARMEKDLLQPATKRTFLSGMSRLAKNWLPGKVTRKMYAVCSSRPMASCWPRVRSIERSSCGMQPKAKCFTHLKVMRPRSTVWYFRRMAKALLPEVGIKRFGRWDVAAGKSMNVYRGHTEFLREILFPTADTLISCGKDGVIRVWTVANEKPVRTLEGHSGLVRSIALVPDRKVLASVSRDGNLFLWDFDKGVTLVRLEEGTLGFLVVVFLDEGRKLATGGIDRNIRIWDVAQLKAKTWP